MARSEEAIGPSSMSAPPKSASVASTYVENGFVARSRLARTSVSKKAVGDIRRCFVGYV